MARLVSTGRTNRQVADELVVSIKTVEYHLANVYGKLGIRSRQELVPIFGPIDTGRQSRVAIRGSQGCAGDKRLGSDPGENAVQELVELTSTGQQEV